MAHPGALNSRATTSLPGRLKSMARRTRQQDAVPHTMPTGVEDVEIAWDLASLPSFQAAEHQTREALDIWQDNVLAIHNVAEQAQSLMRDLLYEERRRRDDARRNAVAARLAADQQRATEIETQRRAAEEHRRALEDEDRRAEEERMIRADQGIAWHLAQQEEEQEEFLRQAEQEASAEATTVGVGASGQPNEEQGLRNCAVCQDQFDLANILQLPCQHWYCHTDLQHAIGNAVEERRPFQCCRSIIDAQETQAALPQQLFAQYAGMLEEVRSSDPTYCSNAACAAFLPDRFAEGADDKRCDSCGRRTCRHCKAATHAGQECVADVATQQARRLARRQGWKSCPRCQTMVEKSSGCMHMTCRCGERFCYRCGRPLSSCQDRCAG